MLPIILWATLLGFTAVDVQSSPLPEMRATINTDILCEDRLAPSGCYCSSKHESKLTCTRIPSTEGNPIPSTIDELLFFNLDFRFIPFQANQPTEGTQFIRRISFQRTQIRSLGANSFAAFLNLEHLDLSGVSLGEVDPDSFAFLTKLKSLNLKDNKLSEFSLQSLSLLGPSLLELNLENNQIEHLGQTEIFHLRSLENLASLKFTNNLLACDCDLYYLQMWLRSSQVSHPAGPICKDHETMLSLNDLSNYFQKCPHLHQPVVTNVTSLSCNSLFLQWEFGAYLEPNASVVYTVNFRSDQNSIGLRTSRTHAIVNNLAPATMYQLSISVSVLGPKPAPVFTAQQFPVRISQYLEHGRLHACVHRPSYFGSGLTWDLTYRIIAVLVLVFTALLIMILSVAVSSFCCRKRSALTPTRYEPRPAYGHEPRTGNAAALLTYAHLDFEGPRTSCDHLKRQILNTQGVIAVNPDNVAYTSVLLTGKFGTMFEGDAIMIRRNQYHCKITAIEFSQRRLFERSGIKLTELASLNHPNVLNVVGVVDTSSNGPLTLLFDHLAEYLDVKTFLHQVVQGRTSFGSSSPMESKNLIISQVAAGMKYLSQKQFVHGDLSARNCIFTRNRQVKISLTGAGIDLYPHDYFRTAGSRNLPIRWMSPECIQYGTCSSHSDVWSMGVLIWEVFSNGSLPYHYIADTEVVAASVVSKGSLLKQPKDCPKEVWSIVKDCWIEEPISRINFETIETRLLKDVWNVSVIDNESTVDDESLNQFQTMMNRLHLTSVLGLTLEPETDDENISHQNNLSATRNILPSHWV